MKLEWLDATLEEIENMRMKAYLSFDEIEEGSNVDTDIVYYYINKRGDAVNCHAIYTRDTGDVIVKNEHGVQVLISKSKLFIKKD
jgi:hypothetical protein